jgi:hypothetical protein
MSEGWLSKVRAASVVIECGGFGKNRSVKMGNRASVSESENGDEAASVWWVNL